MRRRRRKLFPMRARAAGAAVSFGAQWTFNALVAGLFPILTYRYSTTIVNLKACKNVLSLSMCNDETIPCSSVEAAAETQCNSRMS